MEFLWDELKNRKNILKHGIDFTDAVEIFSHPMLTNIDCRSDYGEERWVGIGFMKGIFAVIIYLENDDRDEIKIISVRKATKDEGKKLKEKLGY